MKYFDDHAHQRVIFFYSNDSQVSGFQNRRLRENNEFGFENGDHLKQLIFADSIFKKREGYYNTILLCNILFYSLKDLV